MSDFKDLLDAISEKELLKQRIDLNTKVIQNILNKIDINELDCEILNYDQLKGIYNNIRYNIPKDREDEFDDLLRRRKIEAYPVLLKATYFPEINELNIPDPEKVRLDNAARANIRYYMTVNNITQLQYKLSIEDLEMLELVGVVQKLYAICCPCCGYKISQITQKQYNNYKRYFELEEKFFSDGLTEEEGEEIDRLFERGFYDLSAFCDDCDVNIDVSSFKDFNNLDFEIMYKVVKDPDLTYEKL